MILATLGKFNATRGTISWRFCQDQETGDCFALRNDGRRWSYIDKAEMRKGYKQMLTWGYAPCEIFAS